MGGPAPPAQCAACRPHVPASSFRCPAGFKGQLGGEPAGSPPPTANLRAWPDAFGAWRQGPENGAAINSVLAAGGCKTSPGLGWNAQEFWKDFRRGLADNTFGALGSKGNPPPFPPTARGSAALQTDVGRLEMSVKCLSPRPSVLFPRRACWLCNLGFLRHSPLPYETGITVTTSLRSEKHGIQGLVHNTTVFRISFL